MRGSLFGTLYPFKIQLFHKTFDINHIITELKLHMFVDRIGQTIVVNNCCLGHYTSTKVINAANMEGIIPKFVK